MEAMFLTSLTRGKAVNVFPCDFCEHTHTHAHKFNPGKDGAFNGPQQAVI